MYERVVSGSLSRLLLMLRVGGTNSCSLLLLPRRRRHAPRISDHNVNLSEWSLGAQILRPILHVRPARLRQQFHFASSRQIDKQTSTCAHNNVWHTLSLSPSPPLVVCLHAMMTPPPPRALCVCVVVVVNLSNAMSARCRIMSSCIICLCSSTYTGGCYAALFLSD